ncbi:uncharacterized protein LOC133481016 isoform X3 [Phyllopteryx taeniolatus]|uniref:uncharacterized protein LOC133481016 isoform X3 n=1 Tax=Phyllopteryx taeniolatus TaxID=161469 RepID=UPI002AD54F73|nr:uncharacterized protein LOC133481016 isoform X3 [Phyllopteryx taeniolatus]
MKPNERKEALLAIKENIEMDLFSSEESSEVLSTQELDEENCFYQRITIHHRSKLNLEHPLVSIWEEELTPEGHAQQDGLQNPKPSTVTPAQENKSIERRPPPPVFMDDIEIEMEVIPPPRKSEAKLVEVVTTTFHTASLNKASRMKWKRLTPEQTGLVVKDVICLRRGHYSEEIMRNTAPQGKEQAAISAMGMTARITIDREWSAKQMESRLVVLFRGRVAIQAGQRFSFTYLQILCCSLMYSAYRGFRLSQSPLQKAGPEHRSSKSQGKELCILSAIMTTCRHQVIQLWLTGDNYVWRKLERAAQMEIICRKDGASHTLRRA